jgi:hypothetical protein
MAARAPQAAQKSHKATNKAEAVGWPQAWNAWWAGSGPMIEAWEYWADACQRSVLYWDTLRKRGNIALEHREQGKPPVLVFDYEMVMDGRELERPVNYALVRILPEPGMTIDPDKRPFVIVDPRAGHGPGIGGSKTDSQVGVVMKAGHPCYFVTFFPEPMPDQTIEDVGRAEALFLQKVMELHPNSEAKPCVVGNCQAGWAVAMLSAAAPEVTGPIILAGAPLSYWAGVEGKNPMRYTGGLLGGTWMTSLANDLGNGKFDGAYLVQNFENLNPANTLWTKQYNLYSKIDTEEERYLNFEKWWGGLFLMNAEEMRFIVDNLFVGNKLQAGEIVTSRGNRLDLRNIRSPIIVFASWGDNITPPQQALHWIADLYESVDEIRANEQVIVYALHDTIGHLGIFVSGKIAKRGHAAGVENMDIIDILPPGLYQAVLEEKRPEDPNADLIAGDYIVRFEARTIEDILALGGGGEEDVRRFETVSRVSEINEGIYRTFVGPWVQAWSNDATAEALRRMQPHRAQHLFLSDMNPAMRALEPLAEAVRENRRPAAPDNPFLVWQKMVSDQILRSLELYRDARDSACEALFQAVYDSPWVQAAVGLRSAAAEAPKPRVRDMAREALTEKKFAAIKARIAQGSFNEGLIRILVYTGREESKFDARSFRMLETIHSEYSQVTPISFREFRELVKDQSYMVLLDEARALATLPTLLQSDEARRQALELAVRVATAGRPLSSVREKRFRKVREVLGVEPAPAPEPTEPARAAQRAKLREAVVPGVAAEDVEELAATLSATPAPKLAPAPRARRTGQRKAT